MKIFRSKSTRFRFGLLGVMNNRGLGTESRLLHDIFTQYFPDVDFDLYELPSGRRAYQFDQNWQNKWRFKRWLKSRQMVMTIERFMPTLFQYCREQGIRTVWRPNFEWISPELGSNDFELVDCIMTPQRACADFLEGKFGVSNVLRNPWIMQLPIVEKQPAQETTTFLFNAGRAGIGNRRNPGVVVTAFSRILAERSDVHFVLKTQADIDVSVLRPFEGKSFTYIKKDSSYKKNLSYYRTADFSLAPSKWEGLGFALLESLYCGTPVITTNAPPMNEWVEHGVSGYLLPTTYADVPLPVPYDRQNEFGLNWLRAALCQPDDLVEAVFWLCEHKREIYQKFNHHNRSRLQEREKAFVACFRQLIFGSASAA